MKYLLEQKLTGIIALLFLVGCGGGGGSTPVQLTVASFSEFKLTENSTSGAWVIEASTNNSSAINYSISGGPDSSFFSMSGDTLSFNGSANYEAPSDLNADGVFEVYVQTSSGTAASTQNIYIRVTDVAEAPTISTSAISNIAENSSLVATIVALDDDRNSVLAYSFVDSAGSKDEALLSIDSATGLVSFISTPNFENPVDLNLDNTFDFTIMVSDGSLSSQADYTFAITDVNEAPIIATTSIPNTAEGIRSLGSIHVTDQDSSSFSFSLVDSNGLKDEQLLSIDGSGNIAFLVTPDFEMPIDVGSNNTIEFSVIVSDGTLSTTENYSFSIIDVNESPVFSIASSQIYVENSGSTYSLGFQDPDGVSTLSYSLSGPDASKFSILNNGLTQTLSFSSEPDYESPSDSGADNVYNVSVVAFDGAQRSTVSLVIALSDDTTDNPFGIQLPSNVGIAELQEENE